MKNIFLPADRSPTKQDYEHLVRHCGFGVPSLRKAMWSASNSLTLTGEDTLHPLQKTERERSFSARDAPPRIAMAKDELEALGATPVEMTVTLSTLSNPIPLHVVDLTIATSHIELRFDVKRPTEDIARFKARINAAALDEESGTSNRDNDPAWTLRKAASWLSLHQDTWKCRCRASKPWLSRSLSIIGMVENESVPCALQHPRTLRPDYLDQGSRGRRKYIQCCGR
jgi:hypothetical protein